MADVLVLVEQVDGKLKKVTAELLTAAKALGEPAAVVVGAPGTTDALAEQLKAAGAAKIYRAESADADTHLVTPKVGVLAELAESQGAAAILTAATSRARRWPAAPPRASAPA